MKKFLQEKIQLLNDVKNSLVEKYQIWVAELVGKVDKLIEKYPVLKTVCEGIQWLALQISKILNFIIDKIFCCGKIVADVAKQKVSYICDKFGWKFDFIKNSDGEISAEVSAAA